MTKPNPDVKVREGDILLGRGKLDRCFGPILISSTGLGFISLNFVHHEFGKPEGGDALAIVSRDGAVRYRKKLTDLFSEKEIQQFFSTVSAVFWYGGGWIDEIRKEVIVAGGQKRSSDKTILTPLRTVNLETGEVQETSTSAISRALSNVNRNGLNLALELAAERKLEQAKPDLVKILSDSGLPLEARLRAAVALVSIGDHRGRDLVKELALRRIPRSTVPSGGNDMMTGGALSESPETVYAIRSLPFVFGDEAAPLLCEVVRRFGGYQRLRRAGSDARRDGSSGAPSALAPSEGRRKHGLHGVRPSMPRRQGGKCESRGARSDEAARTVPGAIAFAQDAEARRPGARSNWP